MKRNERCLCEDCGLFVMDKDKENAHAGHRIRHTLTDNELMNPTLILPPKSDNHGQAVCKSLLHVFLKMKVNFVYDYLLPLAILLLKRD